MERWLVVGFLIGGMTACLAAAAWAQGGDEVDFLSVPMLGKGGFSVMGTATPEVALPATFTFNPAALGAAATAFQVKHGVEFDLGRYTFREGPDVTLDIENYFFPVQGGLIRLARYGVRSNTQEARALPGVGARLRDGEAWEVSWGQRVCPQWHVGLAFVPRDKVETVLSSNGVVLAQGAGESLFQARAGVHYQSDADPMKAKWTAGAVYAWEKDRSHIVLFPPLTGAPGPVEMSGRYRNIVTMVGVAYQPRQGTILIGNLEKYRLAGPGIDERLNIWFYGVQQFLTRSASLTIGSLQRGFFVSVNYYRGTKMNIGISYSPRPNRRLEEFLGRSKGGYVWVAINY